MRKGLYTDIHIYIYIGAYSVSVFLSSSTKKDYFANRNNRKCTHTHTLICIHALCRDHQARAKIVFETISSFLYYTPYFAPRKKVTKANERISPYFSHSLVCMYTCIHTCTRAFHVRRHSTQSNNQIKHSASYISLSLPLIRNVFFSPYKWRGLGGGALE